MNKVINYDVHRVDGVDKNTTRVRKLLESYARNISTMAANETIMADVRATDQTISPNTFAIYLSALRRIFIVDDVPAWSPALRSKTKIRTSPKRHFVDPSIAVALMGINPQGLLKDFPTFGFLFEDLCARDLRVYAQALDGEVYHYRDKNELECDLVVVLRDGRWGAVEVKLGKNEEEDAAKHLIELSENIEGTAIPTESEFKDVFAFAAAATTLDAAYALDDTSFVTAYVKMLRIFNLRYPNAKVVMLIGDHVIASCRNSILAIGEYYRKQCGYRVVDFQDISAYKENKVITKVSSSHPDENGFEVMASYIYQQVGDYLESDVVVSDGSSQVTDMTEINGAWN